jgi:hypothetical protein
MANTRTIRVTSKENPDKGTIVINEADFNADKYDRVDPEGVASVAPLPTSQRPAIPPRASQQAILQAYDLPPNHDPARGKPDDLRRLEEATPAHLRPQPLPHPGVLPDAGALSGERQRLQVDESGNIPGTHANQTATGPLAPDGTATPVTSREPLL